jgi:tetratricopeptide (TPR) repeat protein
MCSQNVILKERYNSITYLGLEMYEKAIIEYEKALDRKPDFLFAHAFLTSAYIMAGQEDKARIEAAEVLRIGTCTE